LRDGNPWTHLANARLSHAIVLSPGRTLDLMLDTFAQRESRTDEARPQSGQVHRRRAALDRAPELKS
jgi:hypothetical protein